MADTENIVSTITAPEALTAVAADSFKQEILAAIDGAKEVRVDISKVKSCDTAGVQLLLSAALYARNCRQPFVVENLSDEVVAAARRCGVEPTQLSYNLA